MCTLTDQAVTVLLTGLAVLYHLCMRNDAELLKKVKQPAIDKIQTFREWIRDRLAVRRLLHLVGTTAVQPVATCRQSLYLHKPAIVIVTSFSL